MEEKERGVEKEKEEKNNNKKDPVIYCDFFLAEKVRKESVKSIKISNSIIMPSFGRNIIF